MARWIKHVAGGLAALALAWSGSAAAQTRTDAELGASLAHEMFSAMNFAQVIEAGAMANMSSMGQLAKARPEWPALMKQALQEELVADTPVLERLTGAQMAKRLSREEMEAGVIMLRDPAARMMFAAAAQKSASSVQRPNFGPEFLRAAQSPAGKSLMQKMSDFKEMMGPEVQNEFLAQLMPGWFRRFGEKAEALERSRPSAP